MRLSAAIRIGSMTTKQIRGSATDGNNGRCAIGAAIDACGVTVHPEHWAGQFINLFPDYGFLTMEIAAINDTGQMTREEIADWVEVIENNCGVIAETKAASAVIQ